MVQVVDSEANMDEHFPQEVVSERLAILFLDRVEQVAVLTVLHDNADVCIHDERVVVTTDEHTVDLCHDGDLLHGVEGRLFVKYTCIDLFDHIVLIQLKLSRLV